MSTDNSIQMPPLERRAAVSTVNPAERTAEVVFSTGADVVRYDFDTGRKFTERLSLDPAHVRLDRLDSGAAPLLNSHGADGLIDQIGVVEPNSVRLAPGEASATVRFSRRLDVEKIFADVCDRIIRNISVGYKVFRFAEQPAGRGEIPVWVATDWMPFELSLVCMGADAGAHVRGQKDIVTNVCVLTSATERTDEDRLRLLRLAQARW
jgi:hypothetical protein